MGTHLINRSIESGTTVRAAYSPELYGELRETAETVEGDLFTGPGWSVQLERGQPGGLMTTTEAAAYLSVGVSTMKRWRSIGEGPRYHTLGASTVRYSRRHLDDYTAERVR